MVTPGVYLPRELLEGGGALVQIEHFFYLGLGNKIFGGALVAWPPSWRSQLLISLSIKTFDVGGTDIF